MVITLATTKQIKLADAIHLELILETKNPTINEVIPAQTASKAVDIDTKVGSSPLSIKAGIL
jgi:hypothetical protein